MKKRFIIIIRNLESSFDEKYKDVLKNNFGAINLLQKANLNENLI